MNQLSTFQRNCVRIGTDLAVEIPSSLSERRAFVVIGAYLQNQSQLARPSRTLNIQQEGLMFWIRKYEVNKKYIENDEDITEKE